MTNAPAIEETEQSTKIRRTHQGPAATRASRVVVTLVVAFVMALATLTGGSLAAAESVEESTPPATLESINGASPQDVLNELPYQQDTAGAFAEVREALVAADARPIARWGSFTFLGAVGVGAASLFGALAAASKPRRSS